MKAAASKAIHSVFEYIDQNPNDFDVIEWVCFDERTLKVYQEEHKTQYALQTLGELMDLMSRKCLIEHAVPQSTLDAIAEPLVKMNWEQKKERATALISILQTNNSDEEILERASVL